MRFKGRYNEEEDIKKHWFKYYEPDWAYYTDEEKEMWQDNFYQKFYSEYTGMSASTEKIV